MVSTNEVRVCSMLTGSGFAVTLAGMMSMPPIGRTIVFLIVLSVAMIIVFIFTLNYVQLKALKQDDDDEMRTLGKLAAMYGQGRGAQVVVQPQRGQTYKPPIYYQQPQLPPQQAMRQENEVNV
jgi:hypothetical protein